MGIMPHRDITRALDLVLGLDIPFWPQLPNVSLYEDMYVQSSQSFPGVTVDMKNARLRFNTERFHQELNGYFDKMEDPATFTLGKEYSVVYHRFLDHDLSRYAAIRGQVTGPVSFGMKVLDEESKPIIYNEEARGILFDFMQRKVNTQRTEMMQKNPNAFVWVDEPGLSSVFSALVGYNDQQAKSDYLSFVQGLEGTKAMHLCANVDLPYLLDLGIEILSFDAYQIEFMPDEYAESVARFLNNQGIICWGIVPTDSTSIKRHTPQTLADVLSSYWETVSKNTSLDPRQIAAQALLAPARCCLRDIAEADATPGAPQTCGQPSVEEQIVETAYAYLKDISNIMRSRYQL